MRRTGFTLIEILLAIALLVMVLSLVGPALFNRVAPATFDYTTQQLAAELRLAREDARRTGKVRLIYATRSMNALGAESASGEPAPGEIRIESRLSPPEDASTQGIPLDRGGASDDFFGMDEGTGGDPGDRENPRLLMILPDGYDILHSRPEFLIADEGFGQTDSQLDPGFQSDPFSGAELPALDLTGIGGMPATSQDTTESTLLIVCVPDGTVLPARPVWLTDPDQRAARLVVASASGVIRFESERAQPDPLDGFGQDAPSPDSPARQGSTRPTRPPQASERATPTAQPSPGESRPGGTP